jgi:hypothetical protein
MNAYKDMLDNVVSPITCVSMNHQNQLEQMANGAMFATSRSCSHNGPTDPRNKPQRSQRESETQGAKDLAALRNPRPTVRDLWADRPHGYGGPSASYDGLSIKHSRTSSTAPSITDLPRWARGPSTPSQTVRHSSMDRPRISCNKNPPTKWIE